MGGCGESDIEIDVEIMKWKSFSEKYSKTILHTRKLYGLWNPVGGTVVSIYIYIDSNALLAMHMCTIDNQNVSA